MTFSDTLNSVFENGNAGLGGIIGSLGGLIGGAVGGTAGGAVGGILGIAAQVIPLFLKNGGVTGGSGSLPTAGAMPASMFTNVPSFASGTPNVSGGTPAILHDNEAVIPLSGNRKVPVEMSGQSDGSGQRPVQVTQNFTFPDSDADSFRKSQGQVGAEAMQSANNAFRANG
jgi:hypothetical protein